jgi:phosphoribosyl 1,2-cyclic phosphodiesterase
VEVRDEAGTVLVLDAGTGIRRLGSKLAGNVQRVDLLLTHLHMDHLQGVGFFAPIFQPGASVHIWGPPSTTQPLLDRLARYLSAPLFPVHLRDVPSDLHVHDVVGEPIDVGPFHIEPDYVCHPNPTVGYRISDGQSVLTYLPDHEPALGSGSITDPPEWVSGYRLAAGADLLIHDAQYSAGEYPDHVGWGHSSMEQAIAFGELADVGTLVLFHHDPLHADDDVERMVANAVRELQPRFPVVAAAEGMSFTLKNGRAGIQQEAGCAGFE